MINISEIVPPPIGTAVTRSVATKAIPITCTKTSRSSQTVYKDLEGNEIDVNDGKTFIQICPLDAEITFGE